MIDAPVQSLKERVLNAHHEQQAAERAERLRRFERSLQNLGLTQDDYEIYAQPGRPLKAVINDGNDIVIYYATGGYLEATRRGEDFLRRLTSLADLAHFYL